MKYYLDVEVNELVNTDVIDLIAIALVAEDNRSYYAVNENCRFGLLNPWVRDNVIPLLPHPDSDRLKVNLDLPVLQRYKNSVWKPKMVITSEVREFIGSDRNPEFWGYYSSTDWVVFYQLFGTLMTLPKNFPKRCNDIQQECDRLGNLLLPKHSANAHNALEDAHWIKQAHEFLIEQEKIKTLMLAD